MTLKFNKYGVVVKLHVRAKYHQAHCSGSRVIVVTDKKLRRKQYSPSLPRGELITVNWEIEAWDQTTKMEGKTENWNLKNWNKIRK